MTSEHSVTSQGAQELLHAIVDGATKIRDNAADLFREAQLLRAAGSFSRALFLHQISMEECAKVDMLGAWAVSQLAGLPSDEKTFSKALANHKAKNNTNAYLLELSERERTAREAGDWKAASEAFEEMKATFHEQSNLAKNSALYVDVRGLVFSTPSEHTTDAMVDEIAARNARFIAHADNNVLVLSRWAESGSRFAAIAKWFTQRADELRSSHPDDPSEAMDILLREGGEKLRDLPVNKRTNDA